MRFIIAGLLCSTCSFAQTAPGALRTATDEGIAGVFNALVQKAARLRPLLDEIRAEEWIAKGAPETYVMQRKAAVGQLQAVQADMSNLAQHPENMTGDMRALFGMDAFHRTLGSLLEGLRRYQNPALADLVESVAAEDREDLDKLESYLLDLANEKEQQFELVDREAQRCRATLSK